MNELLVSLYTPTKTYTFGSNEELNRLLGDQNQQTSTVEIFSKDLNRDGKDEEIQVDISVAGINPADI